MKISIKQLIIPVFIVMSVFIFRYIGITDTFNLTTLQQSAHMLESYVDAHYFISVFLYVLSIAFSGAIAIPITALLTVAGGYLFGAWLGALYAALGATLGGILVFVLVRYALSNIVQKKLPTGWQVFYKNIEQYGHWYVMMLQISPVSPTPLINVLAGLTRMSLWQFIWADFIGLLPGSLVYTLAGEQLHDITSIKDILSWQVALILGLLSLMGLVPIIWNYIKK